ncbi:hypothetical protein FRC02_001210 [Tulasnella sp. 418]|nr:hypothetical protein FRC02_001210 [Tulasnella sp. 418]
MLSFKAVLAAPVASTVCELGLFKSAAVCGGKAVPHVSPATHFTKSYADPSPPANNTIPLAFSTALVLSTPCPRLIYRRRGLSPSCSSPKDLSSKHSPVSSSSKASSSVQVLFTRMVSGLEAGFLMRLNIQHVALSFLSKCTRNRVERISSTYPSISNGAIECSPLDLVRN